MILMPSDLDIPLLEQLIDILQSCFSIEEASTAIKPLMEQLFPKESGGIYVLSSSKNLLKAIATWGPTLLTSDPAFAPHECLALQRGQAYLVEDTHHGLLCQHIRPDAQPVETFCIPMVAHGEILGVLSICSLYRGRITETKPLALKVAKYIGLALANLKLRETLKNQSFRDPLTKLYNQRYLEESLQREILRSERHLQSLGLIILDVDHFKDVNQTFGYAAGDVLLREIAMLLRKQIRASDIACRYRQEGFLLLFPETSLEITQQRAEQLCHNIRQLNIQYKSQSLDSITVSCGVASFPEHGLSDKEIIRAAHLALNRARKQGRDRVVTASSMVSES